VLLTLLAGVTLYFMTATFQCITRCHHHWTALLNHWTASEALVSMVNQILTQPSSLKMGRLLDSTASELPDTVLEASSEQFVTCVVHCGPKNLSTVFSSANENCSWNVNSATCETKTIQYSVVFMWSHHWYCYDVEYSTYSINTMFTTGFNIVARTVNNF